MPLNLSPPPWFEADLDEGVIVVDLNGPAGTLVAGHLGMELERRQQNGLHVLPCLVTFVKKLRAAAIQAEDVESGAAERDEEPADADELIEASSAPVFDIRVSSCGNVQIDATTKMGHMIARTLRDHRDWQLDQGFRLPPVVGAFGAELANLSRLGRRESENRPIAPLPPQTSA
jgi:hypothetical protein